MSSFVHEALLYRGDTGYVDGSVPFLREGIAAGQQVFAMVPPDRIDDLRAALGKEAAKVRFLDVTEAGRNPARIIPALRSLLGSEGVKKKDRSARGIIDPMWPGRGDAETTETLLHDALVNVTFDDARLHLRCPIDADRPEALDAAAHNHSSVIESGEARPSEQFDPKHARALFAAELPEPTSVADMTHFCLDDLPELRDLVTIRADTFGLSRDRALDLTLATNEIVTNSICHGGERGTLRIWDDGGSVVCEVSDSGQIADPLVGRTVPAASIPGGRGVWLANQLCDLVQIRSSAMGTVVRLHMRHH